MNLSINLQIPDKGKLPGTCAWVINQIQNSEFRLGKTKGGKACLVMKTGDKEKVIVIRDNVEFDYEYQGYFPKCIDETGYYCVYPTGGEIFQGMFDVYLTNAALRYVDDLINQLAEKFHATMEENEPELTVEVGTKK